MSQLGLGTIKEKIEVVKQMQFLRNLKGLKAELSFFNYYQKYVQQYTAIMQPLMQLKTAGFK